MAKSEPDALSIRQSATLTTLVAERLEGSILSGALPVGERINEAILAKELGVSRGPIREAARLLAARGLVEFVANKGAYVREVGVQELDQIYDLRAVLTGHACQLAATSKHADVNRLTTLHAAMQAAAEEANAKKYYKLNLEFHDALVEMAGSARLAEMLQDLVRETHLCRQVSLSRHPDMTRSNLEHGRIIDAIRAGNGQKARDCGEAHVRAGKARFDAANASSSTAERSSAG